MAYKHKDAAKGLLFNLKVDHILGIKEAQSNRCSACNIALLWAFQPKDTQQFSGDRLDNTVGHIHDNIRLTCLECCVSDVASNSSQTRLLLLFYVHGKHIRSCRDGQLT